MIEKLIVLEDIDPVIFYGVNNANIQLIKALYPKLRIVARGNVIKVLGDEEEMCAFEENITKLEKYCAEYNSLKEEVIIDIIKGNAPQAEQTGNVIVFSVTGKPIIPRSENQLKLVEGFAKNDMVFAIGPAGSGKTYTAIALAVRALKNKEIKKIILSRPAVEAGEKLGFLPGDMKDKIDPYLQPLYDALQDMIPAAKLKEYMELNIIQIAPLAFMRGRTLNDAVVILDADCHRYRHDDRHDHRRYRYQRRFLRGDGLYDAGMDDGKRRYRCGSGGSHRAGDRDCLWSGTGIPGCLHGYPAIHCYPGGYVLCPRHDCDHFQGHDQYYE